MHNALGWEINFFLFVCLYFISSLSVFAGLYSVSARQILIRLPRRLIVCNCSSLVR